MAKKKRSKTSSVDLGRLSQSEVAVLIGKPAVWLRDNAHLFQRNEDSTYDGPSVVRVMQTQFRPANLNDDELEPLACFADDVVGFAVSSPAAAVRLLEGIDRIHGAAGLAAVAQQLLESLRERRDESGDVPLRSADEIRDEAESEIARREHREARQQYLCAIVCESCNRYRWGRNWKEGSPPHGYAIDKIVCPSCENGKRKRK